MDSEYYTVLWGSVDDELALLHRYLQRDILPKLSDDFATTPPPKTEDHRQLAQVSEDDLKVLLEDELEGGADFFAPGILVVFLCMVQYQHSVMGRLGKRKIFYASPQARDNVSIIL